MADADAGLTPEELAFKKKYGRLPPKKKTAKGPLGRIHGGGHERKFFDSADHAMNNAGMQAENGKVIATAANIPRRSHTRPSAMVDSAKEHGEGEDAGTEQPEEASGDAAEAAPAPVPPATEEEK